MKNEKHGLVRIIAGQWRGRKLKVLDRQGLRPTPDRVRETLFNWLQTDLPGSRCLDLFAGSGALGFESASRGAENVTMIERDAETVSVIKENVRMLAAKQIQVKQAEALELLTNANILSESKPFDIAYVDPPYHSGLVAKCCNLLESGQWLGDNAKIYIEYDAKDHVPVLPGNWTCIKSKKAGQVRYNLYSRQVI